MNLVGYTATALSSNDIADTPKDKNVVSGAIVELKTLQGDLVTIYDDASGTNPETQKSCDSDGQCTFYAEEGDYNLEVNGKPQKISLFFNKDKVNDIAAWGERFVGYFVGGFTYTKADDVAKGADGKYYRYSGASAYPVVVNSGTVPSLPVYTPVVLSDAESVKNTDGSNAQDTYDATKALLVAQGLSGNYGFFEKGFTYNSVGDVGVDVDGGMWELGSGSVSVAAGTVPSEPEYIRVTLESNPAGFGHKLILKLNSNVEDAYLYFQSDSTGVSDAAWIRLFSNHIASKYLTHTVVYYLWNPATDEYNAPVTIQVGTGGNTLHIYNAAASGQSRYYFQSFRAERMYDGRQFDLILQSLGHNGDILDTNRQHVQDSHFSGYNMLRKAMPNSEIVVVLQNFRTDHEQYSFAAVSAMRNIAAELGLPVIDVYSLFKAKQKAGSLSEWMSDTTHPNSVGYRAWADLVISQFDNKIRQGYRLDNPLSKFSRSLIRDPYLVDWYWDSNSPVGTTVAGTTATKETTLKETGQYSVKLESNSATNGNMQWNLNGLLPTIAPDTDLLFMVRMYIPSSNAAGTCGRLYASLSSGTETTPPEFEARDAWIWKILTIPRSKLKDATTFYALLYTGSAGETIYVDRVNLLPFYEMNDATKPALSFADYYHPDNVRQTASNIVSVVGNNVTIDSSSEVSPTPSFDLDVFNLEKGSTYRATWVNNATSGNVFAKRSAGGGSTVLSQTSITSEAIDFSAKSSSATLRFFVDAASVPVTTGGISIVKIGISEFY